MSKKDSFQANLQVYHRKKCKWRNDDVRKVPNGGFLYIRDKKIPALGIKYWEELGGPDNDEPAWAKMTDEMMGGWQGADKYWEKHEAMCCNLHRNSAYDLQRIASKDICFLHYQGGK